MDHRELVSLELDDGWEGVEAEVRQLKALKEGLSNWSQVSEITAEN